MLAGARPHPDAAAARTARSACSCGRRREVALRLRRCATPTAQRRDSCPKATTELATASLVQRLEAVVAAGQPRQPQLRDHQPLAADRRRREQGAFPQGHRAGAPALRHAAELAAVLHALESGHAAAVRRQPQHAGAALFLRAGAGRRRQSGGLDVSFDLYGYLRRAAAAYRTERSAARRQRGDVRCALKASARAPGCSAPWPAGRWSLWVLALAGMGGRDRARCPTIRRWSSTCRSWRRAPPERLGPLGAVRRNHRASAVFHRPPAAIVLADAGRRRRRSSRPSTTS